MNDDDLIFRQSAIDAIRFGISHITKINVETGEMEPLFKSENEELEEAVLRVSEIPSVQPERKTGHWEHGKCSLCGGHAPYWAMASTYYQSSFCPNCGARMEPEDE